MIYTKYSKQIVSCLYPFTFDMSNLFHEKDITFFWLDLIFRNEVQIHDLVYICI